VGSPGDALVVFKASLPKSALRVAIGCHPLNFGTSADYKIWGNTLGNIFKSNGTAA
jgi:hypothetical protein